MRPLLQILTPRSHWFLKKSYPSAKNNGHTTLTNVASMSDTLTLLPSTRKEVGDKFLRLEDGSEGAMPWTPTFPSPTLTDSRRRPEIRLMKSKEGATPVAQIGG